MRFATFRQPLAAANCKAELVFNKLWVEFEMSVKNLHLTICIIIGIIIGMGSKFKATTLSNGIRVYIYGEGEVPPPHVHLYYKENRAKIEIGTWVVSSTYTVGFSKTTLKKSIKELKKLEEELLEIWREHYEQEEDH